MGERMAQLELIQIECQPQQVSLPALHLQTAPRGTRRQLALDGREATLDQGAPGVDTTREMAAHLRSPAAQAPVGLAALGGDDTAGPQRVPHVAMVALAIELSVSQDPADR